MQDRIEIFGKGSLIQHGKLNDRVYLLKMGEDDFPGIIGYIQDLAKKSNYSKLFCKVPSWAVPAFVAEGFVTEAFIPLFYRKQIDVFFLSKFLTSGRLVHQEHKKLSELVHLLSSIQGIKKPAELKDNYCLKLLTPDRAEDISELYKRVFVSYPFPVHDADYIRNTMKKHIQYYGIEKDERLVAMASAETDSKGKNAEMTDFATIEEYRRNNLALILLVEMERNMKSQGIQTLYTIARLNSQAMNKIFLRFNYKYGGILINNTNISGNIESMVVYYKHI
jgi:putative beta-lysine N-acetyltransferase